MKEIPPVNAALCRRTGMLCTVTGAAFVLIPAALWLNPAWAEFIAREQADLQTEPITLTLTVRLACLGISLLDAMVLLWGLWTMRSLFGHLATGKAFETETGVLLRRFGKAILIYAGLIPILRCLTNILVTMHNPPGKHWYTLSVGDEEIILALIGTLILVLGSVLAEAARIADENRQIV